MPAAASDLARPLSIEALAAVCAAVLPGGRVLRVRRLRGGISSSVHLVQLGGPHGERRDAVVRRYNAWWQRTDPAVCVREWKLLGALEPTPVPAPRPLLLDADGALFGAPTVVMTRLPGRGALAPRNLADYLSQMAHTLAALHATPVDGLTFLPEQRTYVAKTVEGPEAGPKSDDPLEQRIWAAVVRLWPSVAASEERKLVHGDFWPGNLLWRRGRLTGVVDWEQPRLGGPARDLAVCRGDLSVLFSLEAADAFLHAYERAAGSVPHHQLFWDLLVCTWSLHQATTDWLPAYHALGRPDITPALAGARIRSFAEDALRRHARAGA